LNVRAAYQLHFKGNRKVLDLFSRKALRPELAFDCDVIMVEGKGTIPLAISEKSKKSSF